jgi:hypothetical protein
MMTHQRFRVHKNQAYLNGQSGPGKAPDRLEQPWLIYPLWEELVELEIEIEIERERERERERNVGEICRQQNERDGG